MREFENDKGNRLAQRRLAEEVTKFVHGDVDIETPSLTCTAGMMIVDVLVSAGLASSKREAREFIESGAVTIDGERVTDPNEGIRAGVLQRGKKKSNQIVVEMA